MAANLYLSVALPLIVIPTYFYAKFMQYISILYMSLKWITENVLSIMLEKLHTVIQKLIRDSMSSKISKVKYVEGKNIPSIKL